MQETLAKAYRAIQKQPERELTKAYLRQIASNAWSDHCRKKQTNESKEMFDEAQYLQHSTASDAYTIRENFEQLANRLNARQMVLILLRGIACSLWQIKPLTEAKKLVTSHPHNRLPLLR